MSATLGGLIGGVVAISLIIMVGMVGMSLATVGVWMWLVGRMLPA